MDRTISVSAKGILVSGLTMLALLGAYLLGGAGDGPGTPARAAEESDGDRRLTMVGSGTVDAVPDEVSFTVAVGVTRDDLSAAFGESNQVMRKVRRALEAHGVTDDLIQTTGLQMHPVLDHHDYDPPTLRGYRVSQRARVTVPELSKAGTAINAAVQAGGNRAKVNGIRLGVSDVDAFLAEARDAAVEEATSKAEDYASAAGESLGAVVRLEEVSVPDPERTLRQEYDVLRATAVDKTVPIQAGQEELEVRVKMVWSLS